MIVIQWCQYMVIAVKRNNEVHIESNEKHLHLGDSIMTDERLKRIKVEYTCYWGL